MTDYTIMLPDIPRLYTALAEWLACMVIILSIKRRINKWPFIGVSVATLGIQSLFLGFTSQCEDFLWILCMMIACALMVSFLRIVCEIQWREAVYLGAFAFLMAETAASLEWQIALFASNNRGVTGVGWNLLFLIITYGVFFFFMWRLNMGTMSFPHVLEVENRELLEVLVIAVSVFFISNIGFVTSKTPFSGAYSREIFNIRTFADLAGLAILYAYHIQWSDHKTRRELENIQTILHNQYEQYQQSRKSIEMINYKYHDLKHHIIALRAEEDADRRNEYLDKMEEEIRNYEVQNKTGNKVLDTLLTSKNITCQQNDITFTCIADGKALDFMDTMDICSVFGNALDNAIECEKKITDKDKRLIHVSAVRKKEFLLIKVENYYEGNLEFENSLPITTKAEKEFHGYGLKSIRYTVHKYGGEVDIATRDNWFELKILIPV